MLEKANALDDNPTAVSGELWFGVDDGRLYGGYENVDLFLPQIPASAASSALTYDLEINAAYTLSFAYPDQPIVITPPL
jgi:hypothetical protein